MPSLVDKNHPSTRESERESMKGMLRYLAGIPGPSGFGSKSTAEEVTEDYSSPVTSHLTAIVTGATSGIGAETARVLAMRGARVVIPARDKQRAAIVKEQINREFPESEIILMELDLSSFNSIRRFCFEFLSLELPLNILINNAGKFCRGLEFSEDKIEMTFATNYMGHVLLTDLLTPKMIDTAVQSGIEGRIVNVSSVAHSWIIKDWFHFDLIVKPTCYDSTRAYAQSKLGNLLHVNGMVEELKSRSVGVSINAVHPGVVKSNIIREHQGIFTDLLFWVASKFLKSMKQAAATTCYVALHRDVEGLSGKYFVDCNERRCSSLAEDKDEALNLLKWTRQLVSKKLGKTLD